MPTPVRTPAKYLSPAATKAISPAHASGSFTPASSFSSSPPPSDGEVADIFADKCLISGLSCTPSPNLPVLTTPTRRKAASISLLKFRTPTSPTSPVFTTSRRRSTSISLPPRSFPVRRSPGPFTFIEEIGDGASSIAYAVRDQCTRKVVCMKVYDKSRAQKDSALAVSLRLELIAFKTLAEAEHPFVMQIHGVFQDFAYVYFAMDLMDETLGSYCRGMVVPLRSRRQFVVQIALGIDHLHSQGIIHRDIKPDNILISRAGDARIADFGFAFSHKSPLQRGRKYTKDLYYTPEYIAPEIYKICMQQHFGGAGADEESTQGYGLEVDWWGLGCVLFQLACGRAPFPRWSQGVGTIDDYVEAEQTETGFYWLMEHIHTMNKDEMLVLYGLMQVNPDERYTLFHLATDKFFYMDTTASDYANAFDYFRARADSWTTRLYRPERPRYYSREWDVDQLPSVNLVEETEKILDAYEAECPELSEFYDDFAWINARTVWTVWNEPRPADATSSVFQEA